MLNTKFHDPLSHSIRPYRSSLLLSPLNSTQCPRRADIYKSLLVDKPCSIHAYEFIGERRLWFCTWMIWVMRGRWLYSCCFVGCCFQDFFKTSNSCGAGAVPTLNGKPLKLTNIDSNISSTKSDVNLRVEKTWTAIDKLSIMWKCDLSVVIKRDFFQGVAVSVLVYGCTTYTQTKCFEKKLDGNYTIMIIITTTIIVKRD